MLQYHHQTDFSDEEILKLNFGYFVKDFTEDQVKISHIRVSSMLMLISGTLSTASQYVDIIIC